MRTRLVIFILILLAAANLWRAVGFYIQADALATYGTSAGWLIMAALIWSILFVGLLVCVVRNLTVVRWCVPLVLLIYAGWMAMRPTPIFPLLPVHIAMAALAYWRLNKH